MTAAARRTALQELARAQLAAYADGFAKLAAVQLKELATELNVGDDKESTLVRHYIGSETSEPTELAVETEAVQKESFHARDYNIQKESTPDETCTSSEEWAKGLPTLRAQSGGGGAAYFGGWGGDGDDNDDDVEGVEDAQAAGQDRLSDDLGAAGGKQDGHQRKCPSGDSRDAAALQSDETRDGVQLPDAADNTAIDIGYDHSEDAGDVNHGKSEEDSQSSGQPVTEQKESTRERDYNIQKESTLDGTSTSTEEWAKGLPTLRAQSGGGGAAYFGGWGGDDDDDVEDVEDAQAAGQDTLSDDLGTAGGMQDGHQRKCPSGDLRDEAALLSDGRDGVQPLDADNTAIDSGGYDQNEEDSQSSGQPGLGGHQGCDWASSRTLPPGGAPEKNAHGESGPLHVDGQQLECPSGYSRNEAVRALGDAAALVGDNAHDDDGNVSHSTESAADLDKVSATMDEVHGGMASSVSDLAMSEELTTSESEAGGGQHGVAAPGGTGARQSACSAQKESTGRDYNTQKESTLHSDAKYTLAGAGYHSAGDTSDGGGGHAGEEALDRDGARRPEHNIQKESTRSDYNTQKESTSADREAGDTTDGGGKGNGAAPQSGCASDCDSTGPGPEAEQQLRKQVMSGQAGILLRAIVDSDWRRGLICLCTMLEAAGAMQHGKYEVGSTTRVVGGWQAQVTVPEITVVAGPVRSTAADAIEAAVTETFHCLSAQVNSNGRLVSLR